MHIAVPDHRLVVCARPPLRRAIEIERCSVHGVAFHCVEDVRMPVQCAEQTVQSWEVWMRRDHQSTALLLQPPHIVERSHMVNSVAWKVQQQHVTAFDGALDPWNEDDAPLGGPRGEWLDIELTIVECNSQRVVSKRCGAIDQLVSRIRDPINWIVAGVNMKIDLEHAKDYSQIAPELRRGRHTEKLRLDFLIFPKRHGIRRVDDLPLAHNMNVIGYLYCKSGVLLGQENRSAVLLQTTDYGRDFRHDDRRQPLCRLIHDQQQRHRHQCTSNREHLLLAPAELVAAVMPALGQPREYRENPFEVPTTSALDAVPPCVRLTGRSRLRRSRGSPAPTATQRSGAPAERGSPRADGSGVQADT